MTKRIALTDGLGSYFDRGGRRELAQQVDRRFEIREHRVDSKIYEYHIVDLEHPGKQMVRHGYREGELILDTVSIFTTSGMVQPDWLSRAVDYLNQHMRTAKSDVAADAIAKLKPFFIYPQKVEAARDQGFDDVYEYYRAAEKCLPQNLFVKYVYYPEKLGGYLQKESKKWGWQQGQQVSLRKYRDTMLMWGA